MQNQSSHSLREEYKPISLPPHGKKLRRFLAFVGPGYLISVGYMDPGNWATDLAGGSKFGYTLLSVILLSNLMAVLLQALSARLGIATGYDLAQACRVSYPRPINLTLWFLCELAIISCDLAEVIGTAIALKLLFHIPLIWGVVLTALDTFLILLLMNKGFRWLEAFIISLILIIAGCFVAQIIMAIPPLKEILHGFIPSSDILTNSEMLYIAIGIIGATVMPHNLYLHSALVQTRDFEKTPEGRRQALKWAVTDSTLALTFALFVNAAILIVSSSVFHQHGYHDVVEIDQAHALLSPVLGVGIASTLFAIALLAAGINSSVTATLAGQIVMEGFLNLRLAPWLRRLLTRGLAIIPVIIVTWMYGEKGTAQLLIFSQIILSMQLPFAIVPLLTFVGDQKKMGTFCLSKGMKSLAWGIAGIIICLNMKLLFDTFF